MKDLLLNKAKTMLVAMTAVALMAPMQSCDDDDDDIYYPGGVIYNALVTVKPLDGGKQFYMQLDDYTTVQAINITESPYKDKEVRALANISATDMQSDTYDHLVQLNWIDSIRTKDAVPYKMEGYGDKTCHPKVRSKQTAKYHRQRLSRIFTPDVEIVTARGNYKGVLIKRTGDRVEIETKPGISQSFSRDEIRDLRFLKPVK